MQGAYDRADALHFAPWCKVRLRRYTVHTTAQAGRRSAHDDLLWLRPGSVALNFAPLCKVSLRRNKLAQLRPRVVAAAGLTRYLRIAQSCSIAQPDKRSAHDDLLWLRPGSVALNFAPCAK